MTRFILTLAAFLPIYALGQNEGETEGNYSGPIFVRPDSPRPPLVVKTVTIPGDGADIEQYQLVCPQFTMTMLAPVQWSVREGTPASIGYTLRADPKVLFEIYLYKRDEFLSEVSPDSIKGYLAGLRKIHQDGLSVLNEEEGFNPAGQRAEPLDQSNLLAIYTVANPETGETTKHYENFLFLEDTLVMATLHGPPESIDTGVAQGILKRNFWTSYLIEE